MRRRTAVIARLLALALGLLLFVGIGEAALRVVYRDGGARTLGGPGPRSFDHDTIDGVLRGRLDVGPKKPGVPRVLVIGDSITYGLGVKDWKATWPELLAQRFAREGHPHEFAVQAVPGNDMPQHLETMRSWVRRVQPDVVIYQWYVNDIEAISHRPNLEQPWQRLPWHHSLRSASYLYYVLDHRLTQLLSRPHVSYVGYLRSDFKQGSMEWAEFEREFHEFAVLAQSAKRRLMVLYPQVPFQGVYPLQILHDRMREVAQAHVVEIPPITWTRAAGRIVPEASARWGHSVRTVPPAALHVETKDYLLTPGELQVTVTVTGAPAGQEFAVLELVDVATQTVAASTVLTAQSAAANTEIPVTLRLSGDRPRRLSLRIRSSDAGDWGLSDLSFRVDYGFEVLDLAPVLNTFNTHASSFDAHPNERAHQAMADAIYAALSESSSDKR